MKTFPTQQEPVILLTKIDLPRTIIASIECETSKNNVSATSQKNEKIRDNADGQVHEGEKQIVHLGTVNAHLNFCIFVHNFIFFIQPMNLERTSLTTQES